MIARLWRALRYFHYVYGWSRRHDCDRSGALRLAAYETGSRLR